MISFIVPVFNGEKYLDECLSSINLADSEIIVVNDGSMDASEKIAKKYTDKIVNIEHSGPVIARNIGLSHARGEYIIFMDADDILIEHATDICMKNIDGFDGVIGLRSDFISPDCPDISIQTKSSHHGVISGCAMFRRECFDIIGKMDEELLCGDGYDWLLRAEKNGLKFNKIDNILCMRRIHNSNMGRQMAGREKSDYIKIIKKHFVGQK